VGWEIARDQAERLQVLQAQIRELKDRWPAHNPPAALLQQLEDLAWERNALLNKENDAPQNGGS
jgi:hypothetical protein